MACAASHISFSGIGVPAGGGLLSPPQTRPDPLPTNSQRDRQILLAASCANGVGAACTAPSPSIRSRRCSPEPLPSSTLLRSPSTAMATRPSLAAMPSTTSRSQVFRSTAMSLIPPTGPARAGPRRWGPLATRLARIAPTKPGFGPMWSLYLSCGIGRRLATGRRRRSF